MNSLRSCQLCLGFLWLVMSPVHAQQNDWKIYQDAEQLMSNHQYDLALEALKYIADLPNVDYYKTICILMSDRIKNQPVDKFLAFKSSHENEPLYYYWLGKIYLKRLQIQAASDAFSQFLTRGGSIDPDRITEVNDLLACMNVSMNTFEVVPLESPLNSTFSEVCGVFLENHERFLFASDRSSEGLFGVYHTFKGPYGWHRPELIPCIPPSHIASMSLLAIRNSFLFYDQDRGAISALDQKGTEWETTVVLETKLLSNAKHLYINKHKTRIIFSAESKAGDLDLYETVKLRSIGEWTAPLSISDELNTTFDEDYPFLSEDRTRLYFCSDRPGGLGKMDIYYSVFDEEKGSWGKAKNMGTPLNSMDNDLDFKLLSDQHGIFSSDRMTAVGGLDIFTFRID